MSSVSKICIQKITKLRYHQKLKILCVVCINIESICNYAEFKHNAQISPNFSLEHSESNNNGKYHTQLVHTTCLANYCKTFRCRLRGRRRLQRCSSVVYYLLFAAGCRLQQGVVPLRQQQRRRQRQSQDRLCRCRGGRPLTDWWCFPWPAVVSTSALQLGSPTKTDQVDRRCIPG